MGSHDGTSWLSRTAWNERQAVCSTIQWHGTIDASECAISGRTLQQPSSSAGILLRGSACGRGAAMADSGYY